MPKMSRETAASHQVIPGYADSYEQVVDGWAVSIEKNLVDMDMAPFFEGGPDDRCPASHVGYVLKGRFGVRWPDGSEEIFKAGDAYVIKPGHTPIMFDGCEYVAFTPAAEAKRQMEVMMPNMVRIARERGMELPAGVAEMASS